MPPWGGAPLASASKRKPNFSFASDADIMSFHEALEEYELSVTDTVEVSESFTNNSGIPFQMGVLRQAVRFGFDNKIGSSCLKM